MRTARGLGWEQIGKKHNRYMPRRFKKSSHASNAACKQAQSGTAEESGCEKSRLKISDQPRRCLTYFQHGQINERIPHALPRETAAVRPLNSWSFTVPSLL